MNKIHIFIGIYLTIILSNCSHTIRVNRSSPPSQFEGISSIEKIKRANIIKTDGTTVDAKNIKIFRDTTTWTNPKTWDKDGMPTSAIKQLYFKPPSFLKKLMDMKLLAGDNYEKPQRSKLQFNSGQSIDVYNLIVERDSTFWFLATTDEKKICPTFNIDRVTINKPLRGRLIGGTIGLLVGGVGGYYIFYHQSSDNPNDIGEAIFGPILKPIFTILTAVVTGQCGAWIGAKNSNDTYIFYDAPPDSSTSKNNTF